MAENGPPKLLKISTPCGGFAADLRRVCGGFAVVLRWVCGLTKEKRGGMVIMAMGMERSEGFRETFYSSKAWRKCRAGYLRKMIWCERCAAKGLSVPGAEVHHKVRLTPENVNDPAVALNWENLELLCEACHKEEHAKRRWRADAWGHVDLPPV